MEVHTIDINSLIEDPANARVHDKRNLQAIVASLRKFGQQKPVVVDSNNVIVAGNGTWMAAKELGWETIQFVRTELTGAALTAYRLADNKTSDLSDWDYQVTADLLKSIDQEDADLLSATGFDPHELNHLIKSEWVQEGQADGWQDEWQGMPEFKNEDQMGIGKTIVHFETEEDLAAFEKLVGQKVPAGRNAGGIW